MNRHNGVNCASNGRCAKNVCRLPVARSREVQSIPPTNVLLVDPSEAARVALRRAAAQASARVESHATFQAARVRLSSARFQFLVTNIRLDAYNGLHLVYLSGGLAHPPRAIVYTDVYDAGLAREARRAGAFYETRECLPVTLAAYLRAALPDRDRRSAAVRDRRAVPRGGRRCWDEHLLRL